MNALKENFVDVYQKVDCLETADLDDIMLIVAKESTVKEICQKIAGLHHDGINGKKMIPAVFRACELFYSTMISRGKRARKIHYISVDGSGSDPDVIDARTIDVEKVRLIILNLDDFIQGKKKILVDKMLKKILYLMLYVDTELNNVKKRGFDNETVLRMVKDLPGELIKEAIDRSIQ